MATEFLTLPDELQSIANRLLEELLRRGYKYKIEPKVLELPATPTISARRGHETHFFLVRDSLVDQELHTWSRYASSCSMETRISICCPDLHLAAARVAAIQEKGIGLLFANEPNFRSVSEARDLAFHAQAPDRAFLKPKVRKLMGDPLDRLERGDWRPAFEDACSVLEEECRRYLIKNAKMGRVKYKSGSKIKVPTEKQIKKMTLGALKDTFCGMVSQNQLEANLCAALTKLNPDRIRRAHYRSAKTSEVALRQRVGTHFWLINNALTLLV